VPGFALPVTGDVALQLAEVRLAAAYHAMIERNRARLARWERWAETPSPLEGTRAWLESRMLAFAQGRQVPTVITRDGALVGSLSAEIDGYGRAASIGYWVDAASERQGLVTASARALVEHLFAEHPVDRVELRTTVDNVRSQAVARRLGCTLDGTLRQASLHGATRVDQCVFTLLRDDVPTVT
jgi:ribosomal-protein-serine acetyltransferase